ncbi:MAG: hypothetical protein JXR97_14325 [Planctomycetes bacterium]|nr:hypothetical protein [Planctomycetota bacterium]
MSSQPNESMIDNLISAGKSAMNMKAKGDAEGEREVLEYMNSLWDRMEQKDRVTAEGALRFSGLDELADRISEGKSDL